MNKKYTDKQGNTKYYASYHYAWKVCNRLNETAVGGLWYFEQDLNGWYCEFIPYDNN